MSVNSVKVPFAQYSELDGSPLEDGYIYIGVINQNPEINPISVYSDSALSIPLSQPIRTLGGRPSISGTPIMKANGGSVAPGAVTGGNNTGDGGGGSLGTSGGTGGSGIIIIRYPIYNTNSATTGIYTEDSNYRYFTFNASGTITF